MKDKDYGFLCLSSDLKGEDFLRTLAELGHRVYLITSEGRKSLPWPYEVLSDVFYMPGDDGRKWNLDHLIAGVAHTMRRVKIDRVIALDDYEVRKVALLREVFRLPGMGQTTARHFHDKLAMRMQALNAGIPNPAFTDLFHDAGIERFISENPGPWFFKRREDAGALGIRKATTPEEFWDRLHSLGDERHQYVAECYIAGDVYHVDSLTVGGNVLFTRTSQYLTPPFDVAHGGGIFRSCTLDPTDPVHRQLVELNEKVLHGFGMVNGASHTEFIRHPEGRIYFLETSARVGGAHLADMVCAASGVNLWREWALIESALIRGESYMAPEARLDHGGIISSLSKYEHTDYAQFTDPEIWWTMPKKHHISFIFRSNDRQRVLTLLDRYCALISSEYYATVPLAE